MFQYGTVRLKLNNYLTSKKHTIFTEVFSWDLVRKRFSTFKKSSDFLAPKYYKNDSGNFFTLPGLTSKKKEYVGKKIVGFTMDQMYEVVSDVENYYKFVPFCKKSLVHSRTEKDLYGELLIGFPPVMESYTSHVILKRPHLVKAVCEDGRLFNHLTTTWRFSSGLKQLPQSCVIDFYVSFEFKSMLHSKLADMFFNELVRQMEKAFFKEAEKRFGNPTISVILLKAS